VTSKSARTVTFGRRRVTTPAGRENRGAYQQEQRRLRARPWDSVGVPGVAGFDTGRDPRRSSTTHAVLDSSLHRGTRCLRRTHVHVNPGQERRMWEVWGAILSKVCGGRDGIRTCGLCFRRPMHERLSSGFSAVFPFRRVCRSARKCSDLRDGGIRNPSPYRPGRVGRVRGPTRDRTGSQTRPLGAAEYTQGERRGLACRIILVGMRYVVAMQEEASPSPAGYAACGGLR
jgi:hypothetical protein